MLKTERKRERERERERGRVKKRNMSKEKNGREVERVMVEEELDVMVQ